MIAKDKASGMKSNSRPDLVLPRITCLHIDRAAELRLHSTPSARLTSSPACAMIALSSS